MEQGKRVQVNLIWVLGGIYLFYTGGEMLYRLVTGAAEMAVVSGVGGLAFLLVGGMMLWREWKVYRLRKAEPSESGEAEEGGEEP